MSYSPTPLNNPKASEFQNQTDAFQKVADLSPNILYVIDLRERKILYVNQRVKELLGKDTKDFYDNGLEILKAIVHPDDYELRMENLEKCKALPIKEETHVEVRLKVSGNEWQWFKVTDKIFEREENGTVIRVIGTAQNVHHQKIYKEKLREEHRRFKNAQAIGHIGSFERKLPGDLVSYSEEFYRILGLDPKEDKIDLQEFMSHVHPDDRESYQAAIDHTHATGEPLDMVTRILRPDGLIKHVHRRAGIMYDEKGEPTKVYGTVQDVTESVIAEEERKKMEWLMSSAEKVAGTGSYEADLRSNRVYFSDGLFFLFGEEPGTFMPTQAWLDSRSHPEDAAKVQQILENAAVNKKPYTYTRRIYHKDGRLRILEAQGNVILDKEGNAIKFIGLVQDVTERKEAEEDLRRSEERSRNLLNVLQNAPDAYLVLKPDLYIEMASDAFLKATLTKRKNIIGKHVFKVFPENPEVANAKGMKNLHTSLQQVLSSKMPHRMTIQHYDVPLPGGGFEEKYWSPANTPVLNAEGEVEYIIHRVLDVTEVMKKQKTLKGLTSKTEILKNSLDEIKFQASQLQESRALLESIFDASPNSIVLYKILYNDDGGAEDFEFMMVNSYTFSITGQDAKIIGKKFSDVFPTTIKTGVLDQFKRTAETGVPADYETWYEGEGMAKWFHIRASKIDEYLVATIEDISERKKNEETLRQMLNGSISSITILESVRDGQGKIIDFVFKGGNKAAEAINGISTEELKGKSLLDLFPGVKEVFFDTYVKVVEEGIPLRTQHFYQFEHYDHWFDVSAVKNGDGFIMTYHDVTEQKKAEKELLQLKDQLAKRANESEYRFATLVTASSDTIYKMSSDWRTMYHLQGKDFLTDTGGANNSWIQDYIPKAQRAGVIRAIKESIKTKSIFELEHQVFDINGNVGWTYSRALPTLNEQGEILEWLGVASNITARKKAEERQSFLLKLSDSLRSLTEPEKIMDVAMKRLGKHIGVNRAFYSETLEDGNTILTRPGYLHQASPLPEKVKISELSSLFRETYCEGRNLVINDILSYPELKETGGENNKERQFQSCIGVPLVKNGKLLAVAGVHQSTPRQWMTEDIALVEEVCERTWAAVERARAEKALREAQESLNIAIEAAQMGTWILDLTNSTSKRNFRHDQIFGYTSPQADWNHEIARKHVLREDQGIFDAAFDNAFKTGKLEFEARVRWKDGSIHWIAVNGLFYFDENGKAVRGAGVNFEITERRQAEQSLRESEQRFRNLVEASALAVWETDPYGIVVVDSPSWRAVTGQSFEEYAGTGWVNAVHPDDRQMAGTKWKKAIDTNQNVDMEYRLRSAAGGYRWTHIKAIPIIDVDGTVLRWSGMNLDIHDRKQAEKAILKAKEEAEAASRAKEDFVSTMSHEIRTPLNAVIGITNLLLDQDPREDQKENLNSLSFSAKNLLVLINDILDFSKLEAGKTELAENIFDLPDLMLSLKQAHLPQAKAKKTQINLNLGENIPQHISTDQLKLSQILHNLVSNAVKFTSEGQVNISVTSNRKEEEDLIWLDFTVQDTGIGIAEDKIDHIFEKFAQAESSTVRQYGGTGLGLSITRLLLDLMGSEIKVKSRPGEGSSFYFSLPVQVAENQTPSGEKAKSPEVVTDLQHIRLLLVEDVEINRKIILQFLQNWWQLQPDEAINGKEAVEMANTKTYDLILMDVRMPVMDGYEATRQIRSLPQYENTPILALTADKNQEVQQALHATQFSDLLTKPFEPGELKQRIIKHLSVSVKSLSGKEESVAAPLPANNLKEKEDASPSKEVVRAALEHLQDHKRIYLEAIAKRDQEKLLNLDLNASGITKRQWFDQLVEIRKKAISLFSEKELLEKGDEDKLKEISAKAGKLFENAITELKNNLQDSPFEISRYKNIAGDNREILQKLIGNALRAIETYQKEFTLAAKEKNTKILSDLVHKNTTSIHYIQANRLAGAIEEYRELLNDPGVETQRLNEKEKAVYHEFEEIILGLKALIP